MNFVKKWIGCIISFVAGVCGLALSACTGMVASGKIDASAITGTVGADYSMTIPESTTKAFKVLTDADLYDQAKLAGIGTEFMVMKVFAIITLIVSVLLIAYAIVLLLKNLNVIKFDSKIFDIVGIVLAGLFLIATIGLFVSSNSYANAMQDVTIDSIKAMYMAQGIPATLIPQIKFNVDVALGVYQPTMLVISIITAIVVVTFTFINRKQQA